MATGPIFGTTLYSVEMAAARARDAIAARDRVIVDLRHGGATLRAIAQAAGLSHETIAAICRKANAKL